MGAEHPYFRITSQEFAGHGRKFSKVASDVFSVGMVVAFEIGVGTIRPCQAGDKPLGICQEAVAATDAIYATTTPINVEIIFRGAEIYSPVSTGTVALTQLGDEADIVNDGLSITLTESNNDFRIVGWDGVNTDRCTTVCINGVY